MSNSLSTTNNNVTTNTNNIATNTADIASLNDNLAGVSSNVNRLNDELTETQTTVAGKQNTLTFDSTPTAGSNNPVTSDGIRTAIDEAGGASEVEWIETNIDDFTASLPVNVTYTEDVTTNFINSAIDALIPTDMIKGTFTKTGMFISSDKRYLKVVLNVTNVTYSEHDSTTVSHIDSIHDPACPFAYSAYYAVIRQEGSDFIVTSSLYSHRRNYSDVISSLICATSGGFQADSVTTCNIYYKLIPELDIELT